MDLLITIVVIVAAVVVWRWVRQGGGGRSAEARLRQVCLGDEAQAARLIDAELARTPGLSRSEATARAVARYERDNH
jgi:hypothetical protein